MAYVFTQKMYQKIKDEYMYLLDEETDKKINSLIIILNRTEIQQLIGYAEELLKNPSTSEHYHLSSEDYKKEITICAYDLQNIDRFHPRIKKLIIDDE